MTLPAMRELTGAELDVVAAGQNETLTGALANGLIAVAANVTVDDVTITDVVDVTLTNVLNNNEILNNVGVGVAVAAGILGNAGAIASGRGA